MNTIEPPDLDSLNASYLAEKWKRPDGTMTAKGIAMINNIFRKTGGLALPLSEFGLENSLMSINLSVLASNQELYDVD